MDEIINGVLTPLLAHYKKRPEEHSLQQAVNLHLWKKIAPVVDELAEAAWKHGIVLLWVDVQEKPSRGTAAAKLRASKFPLLAKLHRCGRILSGTEQPRDVEKRAVEWIKVATSLRELTALQIMVMDLEVRMAIHDSIPAELGAWARLATVLMDNFDERVSEVH
jgi:hypothetical protein